MINQPVHVPKEQVVPLDEFCGSPFGDVRVCKVNIISHKIIVIYAVVALITITNANFIC